MTIKHFYHSYINDKKLSTIQKLSILLILIGIALRIYHFFANRSLWLDEALLSNNIISRDFAGLLGPLDDRQIAPIGFLFFQKLSIILFGANEYALRLFSLLCGIGSLPLFYFTIKKIADEKAAFLGLLFFVFGKYLLYYSHEAKQYNADLLAYLLILYFIYLKDLSKLNYQKLVGISLLGALTVWFSHISIILLSTLGSVIFIESLLKKDPKRIIKILVPCSIWLASIAAVYLLFLYNNSNEGIQQSVFASIGYFPPSPFRVKDIPWLFDITIHAIQYPLGTMSGVFILLLMFCGVFYAIKKRNYKVLLAGLPILVHLAISYFKLYPFYGRFLLYTIVYSLILLSLGFKLLFSIKPPYGFFISLVASIAFMFAPAQSCLERFNFEDIKPSISYIEEQHEDENMLYVFYGAVYAYTFYENKYELPEETYFGKVYDFNAVRLTNELDELEKSASTTGTWFLFSHISKEQKNQFCKLIATRATLIKSFELNGASAYLYNFPDTVESK